MFTEVFNHIYQVILYSAITKDSKIKACGNWKDQDIPGMVSMKNFNCNFNI
jgi:hypothetical protein